MKASRSERVVLLECVDALRADLKSEPIRPLTRVAALARLDYLEAVLMGTEKIKRERRAVNQGGSA